MGRFGTVLVADDDERVLTVFARYLRAGRKVLIARDGSGALGLARKHAPDLAIVDLALGPDSGLDVIRALKRDRLASIAVLISGYASVDVTVRAMRAGADDVVVKPVTWAEILRRLEPAANDAANIETPTLARAEWEHVHRVLSDCDGNISLAARKLAMHRSTLQRWLHRHAPTA